MWTAEAAAAATTAAAAASAAAAAAAAAPPQPQPQQQLVAYVRLTKQIMHTAGHGNASIQTLFVIHT